MRYLVFVVLVIILSGALLGQWLKQGAGLVLLSYQGLVIETSLWIGIFVLFLFIILLMVFYSVVMNFIRLPTRLSRWRRSRETGKAVKELKAGILALIGGNPKQCYDALHNSSQAENRLVAAEAALSLKDHKRAAKILTTMLDPPPAENLKDGIAFLQARIHLAHREYDDALALIDSLRKKGYTGELFNQTLREIYTKAGRWQEFAKLSSGSSSSPEELLADYQLYFNNETNSDRLMTMWDEIPARYRKDVNLLSCYALNLNKRGRHDQAEAILTLALKKNYHPLMVDSYKQIASDKPLKQLHFLEELLKKGYEDKSLLAALAALARRSQLTVKAKGYYEKLIHDYEAEPVDSFAYAELLSKGDNAADKEKARQIFYALAAERPLNPNS